MRSLAHHRARQAGDLLLVTRQAAVVLGVATTTEYLRKQASPVACDVTSRAALYDLDQLTDRFVCRRVS